MVKRNDEGIVLRCSDYSETSQIVTLFSRDSGLLRVIAKGARRGTRTRFAAGLDLLEHGHLTYAPPGGDAGLGTLTEWVQRDAFSGVRGSLPTLYAALFAAETVPALTEEYDPHPGIFSALLELLNRLTAVGREDPGELPHECLAALVRFQLRLLDSTGLTPQFNHCVECGRPARAKTMLYFSARAGGVLCRDCEMHHVDKRRLPPGVLADDGLRLGWPTLELLTAYLNHVAGRKFDTQEQLRTLLAGGARPDRPEAP